MLAELAETCHMLFAGN